MMGKTQFRQCPYCGSTAVRTSHVHPWSEPVSKRIWLKITLRKPYRCLDCDERYFDLRFKRRIESATKAA
jgi:DNA-directed RNA polymerase subunit RPC12/RpoP